MALWEWDRGVRGPVQQQARQQRTTHTSAVTSSRRPRPIWEHENCIGTGFIDIYLKLINCAGTTNSNGWKMIGFHQSKNFACLYSLAPVLRTSSASLMDSVFILSHSSILVLISAGLGLWPICPNTLGALRLWRRDSKEQLILLSFSLAFVLLHAHQ